MSPLEQFIRDRVAVNPTHGPGRKPSPEAFKRMFAETQEQSDNRYNRGKK